MIDDDNLAIHFPTALKSIVIFLRSYNSHYAAFLPEDNILLYIMCNDI